MSYTVFVEEDHSGSEFATGRNKVWRKQVPTIKDGKLFISSLIIEGYKLRYATITHDKVKRA